MNFSLLQTTMNTPEITSTPVSRRTPSVGASSLNVSAEFSDNSQVITVTVGQLRTIISESVKEATGEKKQRKKDIVVDKQMQNEIHTAVKHLAETGAFWDFSVGFRDGQNPNHTNMTKEVLKALSNRLEDVNRDMAYRGCRTYFLTLKAQDKKEKKGTKESFKKNQRKRQRLSNARSRRVSQIRRLRNISEEDKSKLLGVLATNQFISSEESENLTDSDSDEEGRKVKALVKRRLPWRSEYLNNWFRTLDEKNEKRLRKERKGGANFYNRRISEKDSNREEPEDSPEYAVAQFEEL